MKQTFNLRAPANLLLTITAVVASALILRRILHGLDTAWDTYAYHLPFAARLAGLCDKSCYQLVPWHEARFDGFPMFAAWLQAITWRMTGKPDYADLINFAAVGVFVAAARFYLRVPAALLIVALLAVPTIQLQLSITYIDVFANAVMATAFVLLLDSFLNKDAPPWRVTLVLIPVAAAVNSKYQMLPIGALVALAATFLLVLRLRGRPLRDIAVAGGIYIVLAGLVLATNAVNLISYGNPVYPVAIDILGMKLPGEDGAVSKVSLSTSWENTPRVFVWLASIFEVEAYAFRPWAWSAGQGHVEQSAPSFRMGGYFGVYVLANLVLFAHLLRNTIKPVAFVAVIFFAVVTGMTAVLPASHELRYYMYWIMLLVLLNAVLVSRPDLARSISLQEAHRQIFAWIVLVAFAAVAAVSAGRYLGTEDSIPLESQLEGFGVNRRVAEHFQDHKVHCIGSQFEPFRFLYAPIFHVDRAYSVREVGVPESGCEVMIP